VPWTEKDVRDPEWVLHYLNGKEQGMHSLSENETAPFNTLLAGLWPRDRTDFEDALATLPEAVQKILAGATTGASAQEPIDILRSSCNSHHDGTHLSVAFFNHSCSPNCEIRGRYHVQLYATRNIAVGEELSISYVRFSTLLQPALRRSQLFKSTWGSACACARCASEGAEDGDDTVYSQISTCQQQLHDARVADFWHLTLNLLHGELVEFTAPWKENLIHFVLQDVLQGLLESSEWQAFAISSQRDGLLQVLQAMLESLLESESYPWREQALEAPLPHYS